MSKLKTDAEYEQIFLDQQASLDVGWLLCYAPVVLFLQVGLNLFESGSVRVKNTKYILLKNTICTCLAGLVFWLLGAGFAYGRKNGEPSNAFIGDWGYALKDFEPGKAFFFHQSMVAGVSCIVATSSVAERVHLHVYLVWQFLYLAWVYPVVVHWIWAEEGWLSKLGTHGVIDFAGSGVVHLLAGCSAVSAAVVVGPRLGRYSKKGRLKVIEGHSATWVALGTFITWFGWFGLNMGGTLQLFKREGFRYAGLVAVNSVVCPSSAALTAVFYHYFRSGYYDLNIFLRGILTGLVAISGCAAIVEVWAALVIGAISAFVYTLSNFLLSHPRVRVDDPTQFCAVFLGGGIWGMVATALFSTESKTTILLQTPAQQWGLFYGGGGQLLGLNILAIVVIIGWGAFWTAVILLPFKALRVLRVSRDLEEKVLQGKETANFARVEVMNNGPPEIFQFKIA